MVRALARNLVDAVFAHRRDARVVSRNSWCSALGVALAAVGCAPPGPRTPDAAVASLRTSVPLPALMDGALSLLRAGDPHATRVILVHGTPGAATAWNDYLLDPPPDTEVLALDRPGFGASGPEGAVTGLADQAAAVAALLPSDGRKAVLLGHSLGGPIVALVAAQHPAQVQGVVLLAGSLDPAQESILPIQHIGAWLPVRMMLPRTIRNANAELMALKPELEMLAAWLPRIEAKVVIVHGTKDDLVPLANVAYVQARLTGARCVRTVLLEGRNHFLPWNSADVVRDAIRQAGDGTC